MKIEFKNLEEMRAFIESEIGEINNETFNGYLEVIKCDIKFDESLKDCKENEVYQCYHAFPLGFYDYAFSSIVTPIIKPEGMILIVELDTDERVYVCAEHETAIN